MIYYYQITDKPLTAILLPNEQCPVCAKKNAIEVVLYMRYIRSLIPIFGMGRRTEVHCTICNHIIKDPWAPFYAKKTYSPTIADAIKNIRNTHKRTLWQLIYPWTSCWLLIGLAVMGIVNSNIISKEIAANKQLIEHPMVGDVYKTTIHKTIKINNSDGLTGVSTLLKLKSINGDTLVMVRHKKNALNYGFFKSDWGNLSRDNDAFETTPYKISYQKFIAEDFRGSIWQYYDRTTLDSIATHIPYNKENREYIGVLQLNNGDLNIVERL